MRNAGILLIFFISLQMPDQTFAQKAGTEAIDSLLKELPRQKEDTARANILSQISFEYMSVDIIKAEEYANKELALAKKTGNKKAIADALVAKGNIYLNRSDNPYALKLYYEALFLYEEIRCTDCTSYLLANISNIYLQEKNYEKALNYLLRAEKAANDPGWVQLYIAGVYSDMKQHEKALEYYYRALKYHEEKKETQRLIITICSIGYMYEELKQYPRALVFLHRGLKMAEKHGLLGEIAFANDNIGLVHFHIAQQKNIQPDSLIPSGVQANLEKSIAYLEKALNDYRKMKIRISISVVLQELADVHAFQGNYKLALEAHKEFHALTDSIYNTEKSIQIGNLESKRELELKDKDIRISELEVEKKRNERWVYIGGIALLLTIMAILLRNFRKQKQSNTLLSLEKTKSDNLLLNILPAEVAEELKTDGKSAAKHYDEVTVLFTDFVDFTGTAEKLSPQALVEEINECFTAFDEIVERNGLEKIKTIGDSYMAAGGLTLLNKTLAENVVTASIEILEFMNKQAERNKQEGKETFKIRLGINTGPVVAGIVGVKKFAYDIWGDTVNIASRMESNSEAGKINISQATYELVKDKFNCIYRGKIEAKNKGVVDMYFVTERSSVML